ncbi:MAG: TolC family protein [Hellea sp.]
MLLNRYAIYLTTILIIAPCNANTFDEVIQLVLTNNPSLQGKLAEVKASEFGLSASKAKRLPTISTFVSSMNDDYEQGILTIDQPLYSFGKINAEINKAHAVTKVNEADLSRVRQELVERTGQSYNELYYAKKIAELGSLNIEEHEKLLEHIKRRLDGQLASEADVGLGTSRLTNAKIQYRRYQQGIEVARSTLQSLTNSNIDAILPVPHERWYSSIKANNNIDKILVNDPLILQKKASVKLSKAELYASKKDNLPLIKIRAEHNFLDDPVVGDKNRIGIVIESNFNGLGLINTNNTYGLEQKLVAAKRDLEATQAESLRKLQMLFEDFSAYKLMLEQQSKAVNLVENTFKSYFRQYRTGRKSWIDVLNVQRELTDQRIQKLELERTLINVSISIASRLNIIQSEK